MEKLISMTDFVLEQSKLTGYDISDYDWIIRIVNYAKFLKQPLKLEMFVPCVNGEPFNYSKHGNTEQYEQAKEKVLFVGFDDIEAINYHISRKRKIEYLSKFGSIELTPKALKQFM